MKEARGQNKFFQNASLKLVLILLLQFHDWTIFNFIELGLLWILLGKADFVILMKAQITGNKINSPKLILVNYIGQEPEQLIAIFNLVKIKNSKNIFSSSKCKVVFGFKYT